MDLMQRF